eukprot:scaffold209901_cov25-Prasinocladus_malaysianus.AAC.2
MDSGAIAELLLSVGAVLEQNRLMPQAEALYRSALLLRQNAGLGDGAEAAAAHSAIGTNPAHISALRCFYPIFVFGFA